MVDELGPSADEINGKMQFRDHSETETLANACCSMSLATPSARDDLCVKCLEQMDFPDEINGKNNTWT